MKRFFCSGVVVRARKRKDGVEEIFVEEGREGRGVNGCEKSEK
jgi:hypothetical protein